MTAIECLMTRRSIRKYTEQPVSEEMLQIILEAAGNAPSGGNQQPWHFVVLRDKEVLKKAAGVHSYSKFAAEAACVVIICHDTAIKAKYEQLVIDDCSAAMQNLLLAAHAQGLGACWIGVHHIDEYTEYLRKVINAPKSLVITGMAAIGYPAETRQSHVRLKPEMIHTDKW